MSSNSTTLTISRILKSTLCFFLIPILANNITKLINNEIVSFTLSIHLSALILFSMNWDLVSIHYKRFKDDFNESIFFVIIGVIIISILLFVNHFYFNAFSLVINKEELSQVSFFIPLILFAYSFLFASIYIITFKCLSDRLVLKQAEITVISSSSFIFSLLFVIIFIPFDKILWLKGYIFYFIITIILSYLYNQTKSLFTSMLAFSIALLLINTAIIFI
ncbi:MAG: hypothetical protein ACK5KQ_05685 [Anaerorhabdus sp.]